MEDQIQEQETEKQEETEQPSFDYRKAREERIIRNTEKRILKDLGEESFESIKEKLNEKVKIQKELDEQKNNGRKLNVYSQGFDDKFVDFVTHDVCSKIKDGETFEEALKKYKKDHPQFLRETKKIQFTNSSADFENNPIKYSNSNRMNNFFRGLSRNI